MDSQSTKEILSASGIAAMLIVVILSAYSWSRKREKSSLQK